MSRRCSRRLTGNLTYVEPSGNCVVQQDRPIDKLGKKTKRAPPGGFGVFTFKFSTEWLLEKFGLPALEGLEDASWDFWPSDESLVNTVGLDVTRNEEGQLVDGRGSALTEDAIHDIKMAINNAYHSGTLAKIQQKILAALKATLETFSDYRYEYEFLTDGPFVLASGVATGIMSVDVRFDTTTVVAQDDIIHVIHHNITGDGSFHATEDFEGEHPYKFAKSRFGWLRHHWNVHGVHPPWVDMDNVEDFDEKLFERRLRGMKGLKLSRTQKAEKVK